MAMTNVYTDPNATKTAIHTLPNNTAAELESGLGTCQAGIETDTGRLGYKDASGVYHSAGLKDNEGQVLADDSDPGGLDYLEDKIVAGDGIEIQIVGTYNHLLQISATEGKSVSSVLTDDYGIQDTDDTIQFDDSALTEDKALTLPSAASVPGKIYYIHCVGGNASYNAVLTPDGSDTIEGGAAIDISTNGVTSRTVIVQSDTATNWLILSDNSYTAP